MAEEQQEKKNIQKSEGPFGDIELNEIIEISRLSRMVRESVKTYEDKTRPIIDSKNFGEEIKILHYAR